MERSKAFGKIVQRLRTNAYKNNQTQREKNRKHLLTTRRRLTEKRQSQIKQKKAHVHKMAKLEMLLEELESGPIPQMMPSWINKTLEQGDCFYSSIFRALKERKLLESVCLELKLDESTELTFVQSFRNRVAKEILANRLPSDKDQYGNREDTYDFFNGLGPLLKDIIEEDRQNKHDLFADWFGDEFINGIGTRANFLKTCAKHVRKMRVFVSQFETEIVKRLLRKAGINMETDGLIKTALHRYKDGLPLITLFNESGGHYEYYSFDEKCPKGTLRNKLSRKCHAPCGENEERLPPIFDCDCIKGTKRDKKTRKCVKGKQKK